MNKLQIIEEEQCDVLVLSLSGRLDPGGGPELEAFCAGRISGKNARLVLDMAEVNYVSSAGLRSILSLVKGLEAFGGEMKLCGLQPMVLKVFTIACFDSFLKIFASRQEAVADFSRSE